MPEAFSAGEVAAHEMGHADSEHGGAGRRREIIEIVEAALLAIVAVSTAWCGYQSSRWDGQQAELYGQSSRLRAEATQASTKAGQQMIYDTSTFSFWLQAQASGEEKAAAFFRRRFRPEYRTAFISWLKLKPFENRAAPASPILTPAYHNAAAARAEQLNEQASETFEQGTKARRTAENYLRTTLLLATVLFLTALAPRFREHAVRIGLLCVSGSLLAVAFYFIVTYPRG